MPLLEEKRSHCQEDRTAINVKKKLPVKDGSYAKSRADPTLLNDFEMAAEGNGDPLDPDLQTIEELCQPSLNGWGGLIAPIVIQPLDSRMTCFNKSRILANFKMAKMFLVKYSPPSMVTKLRNETTNFCQRPDESLFEEWECGTFMKRCLEECYDLIENMTAHHNDWDTSAQRSESSSSITSSSDTEIAALKAEMVEINKNLMRVLQPLLAKPRTYMLREPIKFMKMNITSSLGPMIPTIFSSLPPVVECATEATKDTVHPTNNRSTKDVQPLVVQTETPNLNSEPVIAPIIEPVVAPVSASKPNQKPLIIYPSRLNDQKLHDKANDQKEKFFQIFKNLNFNISFADALIRMPKFVPTIKTLLTNKDKLSRCARTSLNEHCLAVLLKKLPKKLGEPSKFLIPCDFLGMAECLALADLGRSFLKTGRALIDVFKGELTLRVGKEAITFNLDQTSRYLANYNDMTANQIDVIDMACEEYSQKVLGFSDVIASGNSTPYYDPIVSTSSPTLNSIRGKRLPSQRTFLNNDPSLPLLNQRNYLPEVRKEHKIYKAKSDKSSIDEPPEVELKDLPLHLEYAFLVDNDNFQVIIAKDLSIKEKTALITVLKLHKRAITWKLTDIKDFMEDFSVFGNSFQNCLSHLERMLKRCKDTNLCLNWEKSHFMVKEGIVLGHKIFKDGIEVDIAKVKIWNPRAIISDRGTHFYNDQFIKIMLKYGVIQRLATAYHPRNSGQVEVSNRGLRESLKGQ
uniref:Reverse transcriptase domain-containing protein n=1 Tax=Tanacetum cinerariifolium TaxID=118510 RepID=A0A6L2J9S3_TANCI|nr:reverse transcriptase domain-containing protein [Tanacetum cinerariifolium]